MTAEDNQETPGIDEALEGLQRLAYELETAEEYTPTLMAGLVSRIFGVGIALMLRLNLCPVMRGLGVGAGPYCGNRNTNGQP
tara:strand:+ start:12331 stop:12576 length:246 start_codon:yes stop_codon:yes gene_type:complete